MGYDAEWGDQRGSFKLYEGRYGYGSLSRVGDGLSGFDAQSSGRWWGGHAQLAGVVSGSHRWTLGAEYRKETDSLSSYGYHADGVSALYWSGRGNDVRSWALYAQNEIRVHPLVDINLGVRYDQHEVLGSKSDARNPRIAVVYRATPDTVLKLSRGTASRWQPGGDDVQEDRFERVRTTELVAEQRWPAQGLRLVGSWYRYRINDLTDSFFDPELTHINTRGVEFDLEWRWRGISLRASHARQMARDNLGRWQVNVPRQVSKLQLSVPIDEDRWRASLAWRMTGRRLTDFGNVADSQSVADLTLMWRNLVKGLDLTFAVRNLFDRRYGDVVGSSSDASGLRWRDGRSYWVQLEYGFK